MIKIAFFSLKDNIGCTSIALHTANYLAGIANTSTAFIEPKKKGLNLNGEGESKFAKCNVDYEDDGTFVLNSVRFYPSKRRKAWVYDTFELCDEEIAPTEDIQIYDFGKVGFLHEFEDDFDKIYLCTDGNSLSDEVTFTKDTKTNPDVILFGASKETFNKYQQMGFRCTLIGDKKEERIPRNFAAQLEITLRLKGLTPPTYHSDWTYAKLEFDYKPAAKPEEKQGFLSKMFGKKEKAKQDVKQQEQAKTSQRRSLSADSTNVNEVRMQASPTTTPKLEDITETPALENEPALEVNNVSISESVSTKTEVVTASDNCLSNVPEPEDAAVGQDLPYQIKDELTEEEQAHNKALLDEIRVKYNETIKYIQELHNGSYQIILNTMKECNERSKYDKQFTLLYMDISDNFKTELYKRLYDLDNYTKSFNEKLIHQVVELGCPYCGSRWKEDITFVPSGQQFIQCPNCSEERPYNKQ